MSVWTKMWHQDLSFYAEAEIIHDQNVQKEECGPPCQAGSQFLIGTSWVEGHCREAEMVCSVQKFEEEDEVCGRESF